MREGGNGGGNQNDRHHQMMQKHSMSESIEGPIMTAQQRKQKEITKRASERTRSQNVPKKGVQSADSKTIHARKMKE